MSSNPSEKEKYSTFFDSSTIALGIIFTVCALSFLAYVLIWG